MAQRYYVLLTYLLAMPTPEITIAPSLSAHEVRELKLSSSENQGNKETFLRAAWGLMSEEEADNLENRIAEICERVDDPK